MRGFGELEGAIMECVWSSGRPLLVREIQAAVLLAVPFLAACCR